ncbi:MAG: hypothetical protein IJ169_02725 [Paludibacteraceae bacterium]|nr:hypothetical protein [Paludibacteraceae bacterium]
MTELVNPEYVHLAPLLRNPERLVAAGRLIHSGRNRLYAFTTGDGTALCIKQYRVPNLLNRLVYRYLRPPKGLRAWRNSDALRRAGFLSPENVAYIQEDSPLGIGRNWYISRWQDGATIYRWGALPLRTLAPQLDALAHCAARMHEAGLLLTDFTPGNILLTTGGFCFVDTNRMHRGRIDIACGLRSMRGLWLQPEAAERLALAYAEARGAHDPQQWAARFLCWRKRFWQRRIHRKHLPLEIVHTDIDGTQYRFNLQTTIQ